MSAAATSAARTKKAGQIDRLLAPALVAGMGSALVSGLVTMLVSVLVGRGFWTPMYGISSAVSPRTLEAAIAAAVEDDQQFYFVQFPAVAGLGVLLAAGGTAGMLFLLIARRLLGRRAVLPAVGLVFAYVLMGLLTLLGLPSTTRLAATGRPAADLSPATGWSMLLLSYGLFGLGLGLWALLRPDDLRTDKEKQSARETASTSAG